MNGECSIEGCDDPVRARGICGYHYMKNWHANTHTQFGGPNAGVSIKTAPKPRPRKDYTTVQVNNLIHMLEQSDEEVRHRVLEHFENARAQTEDS